MNIFYEAFLDELAKLGAQIKALPHLGGRMFKMTGKGKPMKPAQFKVKAQGLAEQFMKKKKPPTT